MVVQKLGVDSVGIVDGYMTCSGEHWVGDAEYNEGWCLWGGM